MTRLIGDSYLIYVRELVGLIGVLIILAGAIRAAYQLVKEGMQSSINTNIIRLEFGNAVILGLEFMVAGDIISSLESPDYYNVGLLAIIVIVRTILSYFLNLELESLSPQKRNALK